MNLTVLSAHYERPEMAQLLIDSCRHFRVPLTFCAAKQLNGHWDGNLRISKMFAAYEALETLGKYDHILWVDAFDAFVMATVEDIVFRWHNLGCPPMVFSAEKNCWPDPYLADYYPATPSPWKFINAGTWFAQVGYLRDVLKTLLSQFKEDDNDQRIWTSAFLAGLLPGSVIDTERKIFQTMWGTEIYEVDSPCVVHYNGGDTTKYAIARKHFDLVIK